MPQRALRHRRAREGRFEKEGWRVRKDGTRFWATWSSTPIQRRSGELIGFAKVTRDVTERSEAQRTLDEAREALFQSQKLEAIGQLTGGVAHDFNNLLMAILGSLDLLRKRLPDDPQLAPLLDNAIQGAAARRLADPAHAGLRAPAGAEAGGRRPGRLVAGMMPTCWSATLGPQHRGSRRDFPQTCRRPTTDPNQLETALLNLAVNARDAMPKGGIDHHRGRDETMAAGTRTGLAPGTYVCLSSPIPARAWTRRRWRAATEPFFTTKGVGKGTGLGLSMVHGPGRAVRRALTLSSGTGTGTTVELWLPVADQEMQVDPVRRPESLSPAPEQRRNWSCWRWMTTPGADEHRGDAGGSGPQRCSRRRPAARR